MADLAVHEIEALIERLISDAPRLRSAGITSLHVGAVAVQLAPLVPDLPDVDDAKSGMPKESGDDWNDPETYGMAPGAKVPGLPRQTRSA